MQFYKNQEMDIKCLKQWEKTDELEELLIQRMVEVEDDYPDIKKLILRYL